ncbi:MAG: sarcosine oxidase subunit alpha family protein [Caulobacteraceae bacterium]|nr:sarcosine oxidase subunit alpha family protein [Caulobacteraceae bacterium]
MSGRRLPGGGRIDRNRPLNFTFEGRPYRGYVGDTLASALLAAGVRVVGRSFKYHRPRGLLAAGVEEANALVQVGEGARAEVNLRATEVELHEGLTARAVNCWPSARFDVGAVNNLFGRLLPAGFYYKTFMWPDWRWFEPVIRRAAGLGRPSILPDPDRYETRHAHCDLLVVGSGPAGLAAALAASRRGERVMLVEQDPLPGGSLLWRPAQIDGRSGSDWAERAAAEIAAAPDALVLTRTTAIGYFDHNALALLERVAGAAGSPGPDHRPRQRLWSVRARRVVLAAGALERPLVFPGNDRPGVMLASAVSEYAARWAARAGDEAVVFTNNDSAYAAAHALLDTGGRVAAVVDSRPAPPARRTASLQARGVRTLLGASIVATHGRPALTGVTIRDAEGHDHRVAADVLAMSGGWNPTVHLFSQSGGALVWDGEQALFRPGRSAQAEVSVGAAAGEFGLSTAIEQGWRAGGGEGAPPLADAADERWTIGPLWRVPARGKAFVDFQNDVTADDIALSARENFVSVEHLKRYTTLGMAADQGKTSNVNALAIMAELTGRPIADVGTTRFRPPFTPATFGAIGGRARGELFQPLRRLPAHDRHVQAGAAFEEYGGWLRPAHYPGAGESAHAAEQREALAVRRAVGLFDGSPLGKIDVVGADAAEFLDRIYANTLSTLKVGRARYGLMLNEQGAVIDDGVTVRLAADHFLVGTTGGGADRIAAWLEEWLQCEWPDLDVLVAPVTTAWAVLTLSGPKARDVLDAAGVDMAIGEEDFPHMTFRECRVAGVPARISRVSFTGEVSFEVSVAADRACELWDRLRLAGAPFGLAPVGIEAWMLLRMEMGYLHLGADTDGATTPDDIGWGRVLKRRRDFVGRRSLTRPELLRKDRLQFVGVEAVDSTVPVPVGSHLRSPGLPSGSEGYVTSSGLSPTLGRGVALAMVRAGRSRYGEELLVITGEGRGRRVRVTVPGVRGPGGEPLDG